MRLVVWPCTVEQIIANSRLLQYTLFILWCVVFAWVVITCNNRNCPEIFINIGI